MSVRACSVRHMKRILTAAIIPLVLAGCATTTDDDSPTPQQLAEANAGCAEVVANEYEQAQRPPDLDTQTNEQDNGTIVITGISRGKTTGPVPYQFQCRHSGGATVLETFERADEETPATSATADLTVDEFTESLTDEQYTNVMDIMVSHTATLRCQAATGHSHVPADEKPYSADMQDPVPYLGGYLVAGKITGAGGMVALVRCHVDADGAATVEGFDVVE